MKKLIATIFLLCVISAGAFAQILASATPEIDSAAFAKVRARMDSIRQYRPTVGLVLAGGGARGLAHLGVIKYMEELGIPIDVITGTSMGGLVGGLYALGYTHDQLDSLVRDIQWPIMMSDNVPNDYVSYRMRKYRDQYIIRIPFHYDDEDASERLKKELQFSTMANESGNTSEGAIQEAANKFGIGMPDGLLYGLNVRNMLSSVSVGYQDSISFADLPIPFACVATDLYALAPKYWTGGNLTTALRSTMAIPFYFRAVREGGEILLDGGMRNNFPVDLAKEMGADIIIGSDMGAHREYNELNSPMDFLLQTITLMASETLIPAREMLNLEVHHELPGYNMLSFDDKSVDDIIDQGYQNAVARKDLFEAVAAAVCGKQTPDVSRPAPAVNIAERKVRVGRVLFTGIAESEKDYVLHKKDYPVDSLYDKATIERMLNRIYGSVAFESVTYRLEGDKEPYTLVFDCQKGPVNDAALGLRADTDENVALHLHLGLGTRRLAGPRMKADVKLGFCPGAELDFSYKNKIGLPTVGIKLRNKLIRTFNGYANNVYDNLMTTAVDLYMEDSRLFNGAFKAGVTAEMDPYEHYLSFGEEWIGWDWESYWLSAFGTLKYDIMDDAYFPNKGVRLTLDGRYVFKGYSIDLDPERIVEPAFPLPENGKVPRYWSILASMEGAFTLGNSFTVLPSFYVGWYPYREEDTFEDNCLNPKHIITIGGFMGNRYTERQIPFFGFPYGYRNCHPISTMVQTDFRLRFARKNFATLRGGIFLDSYSLVDFIHLTPIYAVGLEYSRQTMVGPLRIAAQWCDITNFSVYAGIGLEL